MKTKTKPLDRTGVPAGFYYRDSDHKYFMDGKPMTGCTTILGVLAKPALIPWAAKMAVAHIEEHFDLHGSPVNEWSSEAWQEILQEARTAHAKKRDEGAQKGTDTHALVEEYIKLMIADQGGLPFEMNPDPTNYWLPIAPFIAWARKENIRFIASEIKLYSKSLFIAGTADFIFEKDGNRYIGDIKTFKKIWDRVPFYQCAGYALMWEEMQFTKMVPVSAEGGNTYADVKPQSIDGYVIFNLPKERAFKEAEDVLWSFDIEGDTRAFKACVEIYRQNANFKPNYSKK